MPEQRPPDDARRRRRTQQPGVAEPPTSVTETKADRVRRRFADHPVGAVLVLLAAGLAGLGGAVSGIQGVANLLQGDQGSPSAASSESAPPPSGLSPSDLRRVNNWRYGFALDLPVTWTRNDPINGDGVSALGPEEGMQVAAYGRNATPVEYQDRLEILEQAWVDRPGAHVLEGPTAQNVSLRLANGTLAEIQGSRVVVEQDASGARPALLTVVLLVPADGRDVEMFCQVPAEAADRLRSICNQLTASLTISASWSS